MANDPRNTSSIYPPSLGPGARPVNKSEEGEDPRSKLIQVMQARSKYQVSVEPETLSLTYELNDAPRLYRLSFDSMPLQGISRWWLYGGPQRSRRAGVLAIDIIRGSESMVQRPVTQQEAEALAYWTSKRLWYGSLATFGSSALGFYLAYRGRAKMKFPFMSTKPLEQYNHFPLKNVPILSGQSAQGAWQFTRYSIWIQLCFLAATPVVSTIASVSVARGMATDSRTQGLVQALKEKGRGDLNSIEWPQQPQSQSQPRGQEQDMGQYPQSDFRLDSRDLERGGSMDTSSGSRDYSDSGGFSPDEASDTGTLSDSAMRGSESRGQYGNYPTTQPPRQVQSTRPSTSADSDPFFYDDASPTSGKDSDKATSTSSKQSSGGSMWDRIRQGNRPSPSQPTTYDTNPRRQRPESSRALEARASGMAESTAENNERDAYSNEARLGLGRDGRDKEQAQREFDEMLEKERQQSGSDEYDRGMRAVESGEEGRAGSGSSGVGVWERKRRGE